MLIGAIVLLPFIAAGWYAYGSPLPSTVAAKAAQRDSGLWPPFSRGLIDWVLLFMWNDKAPNLGFAPVTPPLVWLWATLGHAGIWRCRGCLPLLVWAAVFTGAYALLRVPFYHWYAAPAALGLCILAGAGLTWAIDGLLRLVAGRVVAARPIVPLAVAIVAALAISWPPLAALPRTSRLNDNVRLYIDAGRWLANNTRPQHRVGYYEIGYIGFYGRRRMIDTLGLIDPTISPAVARRDFTYALRERRPDFILEKRGAGLNGFLGEQWFKDQYRSRAIMSVRGPSTEAVIIHERIAGRVAAPPAR
jgi:hypothetical protein